MPQNWIDAGSLLLNAFVGVIALVTFVWGVGTYVASLRFRQSEAARRVTAVIFDIRAAIDTEGLEGARIEVRLDGPPWRSQPKEREALEVVVRVTNRSSEVVGPVHVGIGDRQREPLDKIWRDYHVDVPSIAPDAHWDFGFVGTGVEWDASERGTAIRLLLRDSAGRWWKRMGDGPARRVSWRNARRLRATLGRHASADAIVNAVIYPPDDDRPVSAAGLR